MLFHFMAILVSVFSTIPLRNCDNLPHQYVFLLSVRDLEVLRDNLILVAPLDVGKGFCFANVLRKVGRVVDHFPFLLLSLLLYLSHEG